MSRASDYSPLIVHILMVNRGFRPYETQGQ
jgi:hypothetical protein